MGSRIPLLINQLLLLLFSEALPLVNLTPIYIMKPQRDILAYFLGGGRLTVQRAFLMFHTTELRKIVSRLRKSGHDIRSKQMSDTTVDGRPVTFKEYYLVHEQPIQTA